MAIKKLVRKIYTFQWEGMTVGMRMPVLDEMIEITRARDAYWSTISDERPQGDQTLMNQFQFLVGSSLACDPENALNSWFAESAEQQAELKKNGVEKELASEYPYPFFTAATEFFNKEILRASLTDEDRKKFDKELAKETAGDSEEGNENSTPSTETAHVSEGSQSESQSTSSAPLNQSTVSDTTTS